MMISRLTGLLVVSSLLLAGCGAAQQQQRGPTPVAAVHSSVRPAAPSSSAPSPASVHANELGEVPVLMYHRIVADPQSVYDRTPADFRSELERLATSGFVPVTAAEFVTGKIDIPAGTHPVVLTFDDGNPSQVALTPQGTPDPNSAVGILLSVAHEHPAFRPVATFFVNNNPFGDPGGLRTLPWLHAHGFDIGNHTMTHANLRTIDPSAVMTEISGLDAEIRHAVPGFAPVTLALPFGVHPRQPDLALHGTGYSYSGVFLVGANPSPSPFAAGFDPLNIPRIRSQAATGEDAQYGSTAWLDKLLAAPATLYTSDGDPSHVSYPATSTVHIAPADQSEAAPY